MTQPTAFGPKTAKAVLDRLNHQPPVDGNTATDRPPLADFRFRPRNVFRNDSGEVIPRYALMRVTGLATEGGRYFLTVDKPNSDASAVHVVNGPREVAADQGARGDYQDASKQYVIRTDQTEGEIGPGDDWDAVSGSGFRIRGQIETGVVLAEQLSSPPELFTGQITGPGSAPANSVWLEATPDPRHASIGPVRFINRQPGPSSESRSGQTVELERFPDPQQLANPPGAAVSIEWDEVVPADGEEKLRLIRGTVTTTDAVTGQAYLINNVIAEASGINPTSAPSQTVQVQAATADHAIGTTVRAVYLESTGQWVDITAAAGGSSLGARGRAVVVRAPTSAGFSGSVDFGSYIYGPSRGVCQPLVFVSDDNPDDPCAGSWTIAEEQTKRHTHEDGIDDGVLIVARDEDPETGNLWIGPGGYVIVPRVEASLPLAETDDPGTSDDETTADVEGTPSDESQEIERRVIRIDTVERADSNGTPNPSGGYHRITLSDTTYDLVPKTDDAREPIALIAPPGMREFAWSLHYGAIPDGELIWTEPAGVGSCLEGTPFAAFSEMRGYDEYGQGSSEFLIHEFDRPQWTVPPDPESTDPGQPGSCNSKSIVVGVACVNGEIEVTTEEFCFSGGLVTPE